MLRIQIRDPGWKKIQNQAPGSGMRTFELFWVKNTLIGGYGSGIMSTLDPGYGMEKIGSATLGKA